MQFLRWIAKDKRFSERREDYVEISGDRKGQPGPVDEGRKSLVREGTASTPRCSEGEFPEGNYKQEALDRNREGHLSQTTERGSSVTWRLREEFAGSADGGGAWGEVSAT